MGTQADDSAAQLLLGLVLERRGRDDEAVAAYSAAEKLAPDDYYPCFARGTLLARKVRFEAAAAALSKAIRLKPPRIELLDMYKQLGRIRIRQGQTSEALKTWASVAQLFPDNERVLSELAELLAEEGQHEEALRRWEQVAELSKTDPYRRLQARVEIAQLNVALGKHKTAVSLFDEALEQVKLDSWLARDIRQRIRRTFLERDDFTGWSRSNPRTAPNSTKRSSNWSSSTAEPSRPNKQPSSSSKSLRPVSTAIC